MNLPKEITDKICYLYNEVEVEDHKLLKQAYDLLEKVHESYEKNY